MSFAYKTVISSTGGPQGDGASSVVPLSHRTNPFTVSIGVSIPTGSANYTVQHTFDDVQAAGFDPSGATWLNHPSLVNLSAGTDGNYAFPVRGVRLKINSGTGTVKMAVGQADMP